jgi:hypothetical protein
LAGKVKTEASTKHEYIDDMMQYNIVQLSISFLKNMIMLGVHSILREKGPLCAQLPTPLLRNT